MEIYRLTAKNDANGNPRRGWIVLKDDGTRQWVEEGYQGDYALRALLTGRENADPAASYGYAEWVTESDGVVKNATETGHYNVTVRMYECAREGALAIGDLISLGDWRSAWIWA